jgi:hypothetical protein
MSFPPNQSNQPPQPGRLPSMPGVSPDQDPSQLIPNPSSPMFGPDSPAGTTPGQTPNSPFNIPIANQPAQPTQADPVHMLAQSQPLTTEQRLKHVDAELLDTLRS